MDFKIDNIVFFEDNKASNFYPLAYTRPVFSLACGLLTSKERILGLLNGTKNIKVSSLIRDEIKAVYKEKNPDVSFDMPKSGNTVFVNARLLNPYPLIEKLNTGKDTVFISEDEAACIFATDAALKSKSFASINELRDFAASGFKQEVLSGKVLAGYLWDMVAAMEDITPLDYMHFYKHKKGAGLEKEVSVVGEPLDVYISEKAKIHPFVVIDASAGPVVVEDGAEIHPFSRIEGPAFIGCDAIILGAKIRSGTYIGSKCRAGGEVENSIMLANSNKYHEGFLGHSYIGEWVNLGALTTNSDLKNNYSDVDVFVSGKKTNTGHNKIGCFIGDHTKTSIGCLLNTGTYIGVMCNLMASGALLPKYIPSFSNYTGMKFSRHFPLKSLFETAGVVKSRRGDVFSSAEEELFRNIYDATKEVRHKLRGKTG